MKKALLMGCFALLGMFGCSKNSTTNNYNITPTPPPPVDPGTTTTKTLDSFYVFDLPITCDSSQWWYDSSLNQFYIPFTQPDRNMADFVRYFGSVSVDGIAWFAMTATINGVTVDLTNSAVGFDINWYYKSGGLPRLPQYIDIDVTVVLKHAGNKPSASDSIQIAQTVRDHMFKRGGAIRPHSSRPLFTK